MEKLEENKILAFEELEKKEAELLEREQEIQKKETALHKLEASITETKHNMYSKVDVSLDTMNKVVIVIVAVLVIALGVGIFAK